MTDNAVGKGGGERGAEIDYRTVIAWAAYCLVNVICCIKYNPFAFVRPWVFIVGYPLVVLLVYGALRAREALGGKAFFFVTVGMVLAVSGGLLAVIDRWSVEVDRWSALAFWSENLRQGKFPYGTPTHLGGYASPFPVWQLLHFPFHLLGDTAYGEIVCLMGFFAFLFCCRRHLSVGGFGLLMLLSPAFWWEIAVRSDLLCNMLLVFVFVCAQVYYRRYWERRKALSGLIIGLFLCTKLLTAVPLFLFFFPRFLGYDGRARVRFIVALLAGFLLPFVPFVVGEQGLLRHPEYNPWLQQTRQGNLWMVLVGAVLLVVAALSWKTLRQCYFLAGAGLFALILSVALPIWWHSDWQQIIFTDEMDKSYFSVCLPFFLFCINCKESTGGGSG